MTSLIKTVGARAVDVGYMNVKLTLAQNGDTPGSVKAMAFPAYAPVLRTGSARGDGPDVPEGCIVPINGVSYFVGPGAKLRCAGVQPRLVGEQYCGSDRYLALFRGALENIRRDTHPNGDLRIQHLVVGLPLTTYFDSAELLATRAMGEHKIDDGLGNERTVIVQKVRVVVQPQGTMINFAFRQGGQPVEGTTLVVDPGGGTLDWYMAQGKTPLWERSGAYPKAMLACAGAIADHLNAGWRDQPMIMERIDVALREDREAFIVQGEQYRMDRFRAIVRQVIDEALDNMLERVGSLEDVDHLLFTGGGATLFRDQLITRYPRLQKIARMDNDPIFSNVRGFQVIAEHGLASGRSW